MTLRIFFWVWEICETFFMLNWMETGNILLTSGKIWNFFHIELELHLEYFVGFGKYVEEVGAGILIVENFVGDTANISLPTLSV